MIVTVTPNPSIDRTVTVEKLHVGEINRALSSRVDPGGKGVNVSRALSANGADTLAVLPLGGPDGRLLATLLDDAGVQRREVAFKGTTRTNVAIVNPTGKTTKVNEPGPTLSTDELEALRATILSLTGETDWLALCGSLHLELLKRGSPTSLPPIPAAWPSMRQAQGSCRSWQQGRTSSSPISKSWRNWLAGT